MRESGHYYKEMSNNVNKHERKDFHFQGNKIGPRRLSCPIIRCILHSLFLFTALERRVEQPDKNTNPQFSYFPILSKMPSH